MSELTQCNCCTLRSIKRNAKAKGMKVTILQDAKWGMGGCNVYVHPKEVNVRKLPGGEDGPRKQYFAAWFMDLTSSCCC